MFATTGDFLNVSLAIGFLVLVIFLSLALFYLVLVLRDVSKITDDASDLIDKFKRTVTKPLEAADFLLEKLQPYIEKVLEMKKKK